MAGDGGAELGRIIWVENFEYTSSRTHVVANILSNSCIDFYLDKPVIVNQWLV